MRRRDFYGGRALLRRLLEKAGLGRVDTDMGINGAPIATVNGESLSVSISHSRGLVAVAALLPWDRIQAWTIGIDVETLSAPRLALGRIIPDREIKLTMEQRGLSAEEAVLAAWTRRESVSKATGVPLAHMCGARSNATLGLGNCVAVGLRGGIPSFVGTIALCAGGCDDQIRGPS
ncbi:MAG: 4'-phosphopantetheinyl transferase superfamily protein [bacterium]|nr:4'-phosphopantetheinyl transferase superfamily protein [bacterium]